MWIIIQKQNPKIILKKTKNNRYAKEKWQKNNSLILTWISSFIVEQITKKCLMKTVVYKSRGSKSEQERYTNNRLKVYGRILNNPIF